MNAANLGTASPALASLRQQAGTWWQARTSRERQAVVVVVLVLVLFAAWSALVQPALRTLREAPAELDRLCHHFATALEMAGMSCSKALPSMFKRL